MAYTLKKGDIVVNGSGTYAKIVKTVGDVNVCIGWTNTVDELKKKEKENVTPSVRFNPYSAQVNKIVPLKKEKVEVGKDADAEKPKAEKKTPAKKKKAKK